MGLLPDLDKLIGRLVFGTFGGRLFCHSLLFLLIIATAGLCLYLTRRKNWMLVLGFGVLMHLVLDGMWFDLQTLLWPSLGFSFPTVERTGWLQGVFHRLFTSPSIYMPEALGVVMLACFAWLLVHRGKVRPKLYSDLPGSSVICHLRERGREKMRCQNRHRMVVTIWG